MIEYFKAGASSYFKNSFVERDSRFNPRGF